MKIRTKRMGIGIAIPAVLIAFALIGAMMVTPAMAATDFWVQDDDIISSYTMPEGVSTERTTPEVFYMDGTWYLISGHLYGYFEGFNWTGSEWQKDDAIVSGLENAGLLDSVPEVFNKDGTWYLISGKRGWGGECHDPFVGFNWTGSEWQPDSNIVPREKCSIHLRCTAATVFNKDGTWYLIAGQLGRYQRNFAWKWSGSRWQRDTAIVSGLDIGRLAKPEVFNKDGTWYLISGERGTFYGWTWSETDSAWQRDAAIASGLERDYGYGWTAPAVFNKDGVWYLISGGYDGAPAAPYGFHHPRNYIYIVPEDSTTRYCHTTVVQVYADTLDLLQGGQINLAYTHCCANVTDVEFNTAVWPNTTWYSGDDGSEWITFRRDLPMVNGTVLIANLTIHCCDNENLCDTPLHFIGKAEATAAGHTRYCMLSDDGGNALDVVGWTDGTFSCRKPDLVITEKSEEWVSLDDRTFTVTYRVKNIEGYAAASNTTIYIDGVPKKEDPVSALNAGESYTNTVGPFECPSGGATLNVTVCADNEDVVVDESDEGNNCLSNEWVCPVPAGVRIEPETLNLESQGEFTAFITLPDPYDVKDIDVENTVECEGAEVVDRNFTSADGGTLVAKFYRKNLSADLPTGDAVMMNVTGKLFSGETFAGYDTVTVIHDTKPPYTAKHDPAPNPSKKFPIDTNITVHVKDNGFGVDIGTILMTVNGTEVTPIITGDKYDYTLVYDPLTDFSYGQTVYVTIDAVDFARPRNVMPTDMYSFETKAPPK